MNPILAWGLLAWWAIAVIVLLVTVSVALLHPRIRARRGTASEQPPVSIIVPLSGLDPELEDNLHSLFQQRYPTFEVLLSVAEAGDPAQAVAERVG